MLLSRLGIAPGQGNTLALVTGLLSAIFAGIGLLLLLTGLLLRVFAGTSPASNAVNRYFAALANQDYATAFQCLDPYMRAPMGQPFTPDWFMQAAQASDSTQGMVTDYALSGVQANPSRRVYTIKVTRGGRSYRTHLRLQKYGYDWRIMEFDRF